HAYHRAWQRVPSGDGNRRSLRVISHGPNSTQALDRHAVARWYSGDTHVHRPPGEMPVVQAAEDVNVAFPLTNWVTKAFLPAASGDKNQPVKVEPKPVYIDPTHVYWP